MKTFKKITRVGQMLLVFTSIVTLGGSLVANAAECLIINETYDPPTLFTNGWEDGNVTDVLRQYVNEGVGHSQALQVSATLLGPGFADVATTLFQSGVVGGNEWATRENTVLSFDIRIDSEGLAYVGVLMDGFAEYAWNYGDVAHLTSSGAAAAIDVSSFKPGVFKHIVLPLNDPGWNQIDSAIPLFDPSAKTYNNIALIVNSYCLPVPGSFKVTIDNVRITTKNPMVPFNGSGVLTMSPDGSIALNGVAEHLGSIEQTVLLPPAWAPGTFELTAANGDKLSGLVHVAGESQFGVQVDPEKCTGRFAGAVGSYRAVYTMDPNSGSVTATFRGALSTVGGNRK